LFLPVGVIIYDATKMYHSKGGNFMTTLLIVLSAIAGVIGIFTATTVMIYYTYIESWTLAFSFFSLTKDYFGMDSFESMTGYLSSYQGAGNGPFNSIWTAYLFMAITMGMNFYILYKGIKGGVEKFAKTAMPLLLIFAIVLAVWVFTVGTPDPINHPERNVESGFAFIWNPNFSALTDSNIWLAAAGQVFFTLSVGMTTLHTYASYLRPKDDIALSGLATASINEFSEVVLGATIAIPIGVAFFGLHQTQIIAQGGSYNLGFVSMPMIFQQIPMGSLLGFIWFFLLFFAGITSAVAMAQPLISFLKEQFMFSHRKATFFVGTLIFIAVQFAVFFYQFGFLDELDYWAGTFGLTLVALVEAIVFGWIFGIDKGWKELNSGADIKIPGIFRFIIKYVTPAYLLLIFAFWTYQDAIPTLLFKKVDSTGNLLVQPEQIPYRWGARGMMILLVIGMLILIWKAWKRNKPDYSKIIIED